MQYIEADITSNKKLAIPSVASNSCRLLQMTVISGEMILKVRSTRNRANNVRHERHRDSMTIGRNRQLPRNLLATGSIPVTTLERPKRKEKLGITRKSLGKTNKNQETPRKSTTKLERNQKNCHYYVILRNDSYPSFLKAFFLKSFFLQTKFPTWSQALRSKF